MSNFGAINVPEEVAQKTFLRIPFILTEKKILLLYWFLKIHIKENSPFLLYISKF